MMSNTDKNSKREIPHLNVRINKIYTDESNIKAYASLIIGGIFVVHGFRVVNSKNGLFVVMPASKYTTKNGEEKYKDMFYAFTREGYQKIQEVIIDAYKKKISTDSSKKEVVKNESEYEFKEIDLLDLPFD